MLQITSVTFGRFLANVVSSHDWSSAVYNSQLAQLAAISAKISPYDFVKHNIGAQGKGRAQLREEQRKLELRRLESSLFGENQKVVKRWKASSGTHGQKVC